MPVDRENKVIRGYKVMSLGEALGHGVVVDETTLDQLVELGNRNSTGVKTKVQHRNGATDGFGRYLGKSKQFRRDGNSAVADLFLDELAFRSPEGDWGTYVMDMADAAPEHFGASPEVVEHRMPTKGKPVMRIDALMAVAVVDRAATNPSFFSVPGESEMADTTALEAKITELSAERDSATQKAGELQAQLTDLQAKVKQAADGEAATLSAARIEATAAAIKGERERVGNVLALCEKAHKTDLAAKYITDGMPVADVQNQLFTALCAGAKPLGDAGGSNLEAGKDENASYKAEYTALSAKERGMFGDEASYVAMRRVDDGLDTLIKVA